MSCSGTSGCLCGCCTGTSVQTPQLHGNLPGLPSIAYRVGTWASFKESMLARLSSSDYPALAALRTRDDTDFTIALLDAAAVMLDILTFYQERLANESYLRTATQPRSLTEMARLIGYQPAPGVSATAYLAFTLKATPGQPPNPATPAIVIPQGTQVQSIPAQGQKAQTFETSADISAKPDWNALPVQTGAAWQPVTGDLGVYVTGTATQLQPGDAILVVGDERAFLSPATSQQWDVRIVTSVQVDGANQRTWVAWSEGLGTADSPPAQTNPRFFAFRQRAALFGYNALDPDLLDSNTQSALNTAGQITSKTPPTDWTFSNSNLPSQCLDLDSVYAKVTPNGWAVLIKPDRQTSRSPAGLVNLYGVTSVTTVSRAQYGLSSKISRLITDIGTTLGDYYTATRQTTALVQSEELGVPEQPLTTPLFGTVIALGTLRTDLSALKCVAVFGKRQKIAVWDSVTLAGIAKANSLPASIQFQPYGESVPAQAVVPAAVFTLIDPTTLPAGPWTSATLNQIITFAVEDANGNAGLITSALRLFHLVPSDDSDPAVSEYAAVNTVDSTSDPAHTLLSLQYRLTHCYERATTTVNANVGQATHGQSVSEIMGSGAATQPDQSFTLKQSPLTYVQVPIANGRQSTLQVQANGATWTEVPSLYDQGPSQTVFSTLGQADGTTDVLFGDGVEGATLPTGQNNIQANYRIGSGSAGNVAAGALTTLLDRPLGVSGVTNPQPATGGQDPQSLDEVRANAPLTVLTLGRAVSTVDYQNFAGVFPGIAKAHAIWIPSGPARGVFVTVAGVGGASLQPPNATLSNLFNALRSCGNPLIPIQVASFMETLVELTADIQYAAGVDPVATQAAVYQTLQQSFGFGQRTFAQGISSDQVAAVIQAVSGVVAVNVTSLSRGPTSLGGDLAGLMQANGLAAVNAWNQDLVTAITWPDSGSPTRICPYVPLPSATASPLPAEILVLDPNPANVVLNVIT